MPDTSLPETPPSHITRSQKVTFDWTEWLPYMADSDLTDDQKRAMIETLWSIVIGFVDLGWEIETRTSETSGQTLDLRTALNAAVLNSQEQQTKEEV